MDAIDVTCLHVCDGHCDRESRVCSDGVAVCGVDEFS